MCTFVEMYEARPGRGAVAGVVAPRSSSGVWGRWCLSVRARLLPLGALPFRRARPQEPPACQTDLCSQKERRSGGGEEGRGGEANVRRSPERKRLEGERVEEDLSEGGEGLEGRRRRRRRWWCDAGHTAAAIQTHPACETQLH